MTARPDQVGEQGQPGSHVGPEGLSLTANSAISIIPGVWSQAFRREHVAPSRTAGRSGRRQRRLAAAAALCQVGQHGLCCDAPRPQRAVQRGAEAVVAAHVEAVAQADGAEEVSGRRLQSAGPLG